MSTFALTPSYVTYQGLSTGYTVSTAGIYQVIIDSASTDTSAVACIEEVRLVLRNALPAFSAFAVSPNGVQQAPVTSATISATAADPDSSGYVASIEFLINGASTSPALICLNDDNGRPPAKPFTCSKTWTGAIAGTNYSITARAIDNTGGAGGTSVSAATNLVFNRPPTATFTNPVANAQLGGPNAIVPLTVTASDPDGDAITKVEFYNGATLLGTVTTGQAATANQPAQSGNVYVLNSAALAAGSYTITAKAYDNRGGSTQAPLPSVAFTVVNNTPPTVAIVAPTNNMVVTSVPLIIQASVSDADPGQTVTKAELYRRVGATDTKLRELPNPTVSVSFSLPAPGFGPQQFFVRAYDSLGASSDSALLNVDVRGLLNPSFEVPQISPATQCSGSACGENAWVLSNQLNNVASTAAGLATSSNLVCAAPIPDGSQAAFVAGAATLSNAGRIAQALNAKAGTYAFSIEGGSH